LFAKTSSYLDFKITTWNVEWLSCLTNGPKNRELQVNNVVSLIKTMDSDIVALQEVGTSNTYTTIDTLVKRLGGDWEGKMVPWHVSNCSQNQGIIYKKSKVNLINASLIENGGSYYDWSSGRFPALYEVNLVVDNKQIPVSFIIIHAKAYTDEASYTRRKEASRGLKSLLDESTYNTKRVVITGDFNDYLEGTICNTCGGVSPYKNFMDDADNYKGVSTSLKTIDHFVISKGLFDSYVDDSAFREIAATQTILNYYNTTSDHIPTSVMFSISADLKIVDFPENSFLHIYPNPTTGNLRVTSDELQVMSVEIFDVLGRKLKGENRRQKANNEFVMDISTYPAGIYFLQLKDKTVKVVKY
jgi:endonuclease/exonuclease/phosphatase family metal-dependent hydrolase